MQSLYGLVIAANVPIPAAPPAPANAVPDLVVDFDPLPDPSVLREGATLLQHALRERDRDAPLFTLFRRGDDYLFDFPDGVQFLIAPHAGHIRASWPPPHDAHLASIYLVNTVLAFVLRLRGREVLHASAALIDGKAVAFAGPGGAGKSTLAACLARRGFPIISEDVTALVEEDGRFLVLPSHARVRLWSDAAALVSERELPFLAGGDWKRYLDVPRASGASFELGAIYSLDDRRDAPPHVEPLGGRDALLDLIANTYHTIRDPRLAPASFERLGRLVQRVPVRLAVPREGVETTFALADAIAGDFRTLR